MNDYQDIDIKVRQQQHVIAAAEEADGSVGVMPPWQRTIITSRNRLMTLADNKLAVGNLSTMDAC